MGRDEGCLLRGGGVVGRGRQMGRQEAECLARCGAGERWGVVGGRARLAGREGGGRRFERVQRDTRGWWGMT